MPLTALLLLLCMLGCQFTAAAQQQGSHHRLFSSEMRNLRPSPIYDFLEQALADHQARRPDRELQLNKVVFTRGSWETLATVRPDDACQISNVDNRRYVVSWSRGDREFVSLYFPIDYELLGGTTRRKMERSFVKRLRSHQAKSLTVPHPKTSSLQQYNGEIYVLRGERFSYMQDITGDTYYTLHSGGKPLLLNDRHSPAETLANWLLTDVQPHARLSLNFQMSDYSKEQADVSIARWQSFCRAEGCTPYYIYEKTDGNTHKVMLVADNPAAGYIHMLSIDCPALQLAANNPQLTARAYLYIPVSNVTDLFAPTPKDRSKKKKYQ